MPDNDCLFCKIIGGEIATEFVHQDERCLVIPDINPQAPTHLLVIPREHMESLDDASARDEGVLGHLLRVAARVANASGHGDSGYRTVINTGAGAGQSSLSSSRPRTRRTPAALASGLILPSKRCYRILAVKPTLPALLGAVWLRFPVNVQRTLVTLRS